MQAPGITTAYADCTGKHESENEAIHDKAGNTQLLGVMDGGGRSGFIDSNRQSFRQGFRMQCWCTLSV
jgi:hypothetical protein